MPTRSTILRLKPGFVLSIPFLITVLLGPLGCRGPGSPPPNVDGGEGGGGGCPVRLPEPQFVLEISAEDGPLPADTRVAAEWSAATEPPFVLSDPTTWKTLDDSVNLVCDVDRSKPPPVDLQLLVCELWTSGAVNLLVQGGGYVDHDETLQSVMDEKCNQPMTSRVSIVLRRPLLDGGPMP